MRSRFLTTAHFRMTLRLYDCLKEHDDLLHRQCHFSLPMSIGTFVSCFGHVVRRSDGETRSEDTERGYTCFARFARNHSGITLSSLLSRKWFLRFFSFPRSRDFLLLRRTL